MYGPSPWTPIYEFVHGLFCESKIPRSCNHSNFLGNDSFPASFCFFCFLFFEGVSGIKLTQLHGSILTTQITKLGFNYHVPCPTSPRICSRGSPGSLIWKSQITKLVDEYRRPKIGWLVKVTVTVFSSGCLQIGFGVLIIDYICNFLIWPPWL
jgi:hypothetical protein